MDILTPPPLSKVASNISTYKPWMAPTRRPALTLTPSEQEVILGSNEMTPILELKRHCPGQIELKLKKGVNLNEAASRRLGEIISQNPRVTVDVDVTGLCAGLQNNESITRLNFARIDLSDTDKIARLAPFLTKNPNLMHITLRDCRIGPAGLNILSNALSSRTKKTMLWLNLSGNSFGDSTLDDLVGVLSRNALLISLKLGKCEIGPAACSSLAPLLEDQSSTLRYLYLHHNSIDDPCAFTLAGSLRSNVRLQTLDLTGNSTATRKARNADPLKQQRRRFV